MDKITIIALTGKARSGKDTAANVIRNRLEYYNDSVDFPHMFVYGFESFAAPLKSMVAMLLDFFGLGSVMQPEELWPYIEGDKKEVVIETIGASPRGLLQTLGTNWGRQMVNENIWLNCMRTRLEAYPAALDMGYEGAVIVITDCRFDNEAELIHEMGGKVIRVVRDDAPEQVGVAGHPSEEGVAPHLIDVTVDNNGTVEEFQEALIWALGDLLPAIPEPAQLGLPWDEPERDDTITIEPEEATNAVEERSEACV
jgi:hypothetical protein